jgi:hypothetical protein
LPLLKSANFARQKHLTVGTFAPGTNATTESGYAELSIDTPVCCDFSNGPRVIGSSMENDTRCTGPGFRTGHELPKVFIHGNETGGAPPQCEYPRQERFHVGPSSGNRPYQGAKCDPVFRGHRNYRRFPEVARPPSPTGFGAIMVDLPSYPSRFQDSDPSRDAGGLITGTIRGSTLLKWFALIATPGPVPGYPG